jgi:hypothetical protein
MVTTEITGEAKFENQCGVGAACRCWGRAGAAAEHAGDQVDEPPVARLYGVAHERSWIVGV